MPRKTSLTPPRWSHAAGGIQEMVRDPSDAVAEFLADHERVPEKNWA